MMGFLKYKTKIKCPNCNFENKIKIPKRISVKEFMKGVKCTCDNYKIEFEPWKI